MKKTTLLLLSLLSMTAVAQDIIVTQDAKRIDAKILEVSATDIKYKKYSYQDGPTFVMSIADVNSILYENGDVQMYNQQTEQVQDVEQSTQEYSIRYITKQDDFYYLTTDASTTRMDKDAYLNFIQNNCPAAWKSYQKGTKLWKAGWGLLGAGLGVECLIGLPIYLSGLNKMGNTLQGGNLYETDVLQVYGGAVVMGIGSLMTAGSIPLLVVGGIKRNNTHEVYNEACAQQQTLSLSLQAGSNGIGLALKF